MAQEALAALVWRMRGSSGRIGTISVCMRETVIPAPARTATTTCGRAAVVGSLKVVLHEWGDHADRAILCTMHIRSFGRGGGGGRGGAGSKRTALLPYTGGREGE
ncbi:hypothetical protein GCM10022221_31680 [Actinocorallia aurea]